MAEKTRVSPKRIRIPWYKGILRFFLGDVLFLGGTGRINRLLKKAHLSRASRDWSHPLSFRRRSNYASFQGILAALYLDLIEQPVKF